MTRIWIWILAVAALGALWAGSAMGPAQQREVRHIGLAGPLSGPFKDMGQSMRQGVELAIAEVNAAGLIPGVTLKLALGDDNSELNASHRAQTAARELVAVPGLSAVIGHYFSRPTLAASPIYGEKGVPLITLTATHPDITMSSPWNFSLIPDDYAQAIFLANYVLHGLAREKVAVIHSKNPYGRSLADYFIKELVIQGKGPLLDVEIDHQVFNAAVLDAELARLKEADVIFVSMNYKTAATVIKHLRNKSVNTDVIGPESLGGPHFIREAGSYADNVYAITPFLSNFYGEDSQRFQDSFMKRNQIRPDWIATYAYEAVFLIARAMREGGVDPTAVRNYLRKLNNEREAVESLAGPIHFNEYGGSARPLAVGQVKDGRFLPARFQLTRVRHPELVKARLDKIDAFKMNGRYMKRSTVVFTGMFVSEIKSFDPINRNFVADFVLWFRWDPSQNKKLNFEMTYGNVISANIRERYFDEASNNNFISYAVSARLDGDFPLHDYPLDEQVLRIRIKPKVKPKEDLILVTDIPDDSFLKRRLDFGSWQDMNHIQFTSQKPFIWSYRNPKYDNKLFELDHSQYNYHITVKRRVEQYLIKLIPLLVLLCTSYLIFFINYEYASSRFSIGVTAMLSAMAFHGVNKVDVGYLVRIDVFFIMTYVLIFLSLVETGIATFFHTRGHTQAGKRLDAVAILFFPVLAFLMFLAVFGG